MSISKKIVDDLVANDVSFITTVPCKQLAGVIEEVEERDEIFHIPANSLHRSGQKEISAVRIGKRIELHFDREITDKDLEEAKTQAANFLSNDVIEDVVAVTKED